MKKSLKFCNIIACLGIINILLFFTPCFEIKWTSTELFACWVNLFTATFGGAFNDGLVAGNPGFVACGGLIASFIFALAAIILCLFKNKIKLGTLMASPFFIASGVLTLCGLAMAKGVSANIGYSPSSFIINSYPWLIVIGVIFCVLGGFAIIDTIVTFVKPKPQVTY